MPVIIHVGTADAGSAVELAEHAAAHKADAVAIVPPYYYSDHTEFEIIAHYKAVHKAVPLPIYIYENPKYSGISIPPGFAVRMKEQVPALKGIKVAYGQGALLEYVRLVARCFGFHRQCGSVRSGAVRRRRHDQSADEFRARAVRRFVQRARSQRLSRRPWKRRRGSIPPRASSRRACANTGRVPLQEVYRMRGFAVKRFPKWETEQMPKEEIAKLERELREAGILGQ